MDNAKEIAYYTFVRGHVRRIQARKPRSFAVECAYSRGSGRDPGSVLVSRDCPACSGTGWITLTGSPSDYERCGNCQGSGKDPDDIVSMKPCHVCRGSGLVKVR